MKKIMAIVIASVVGILLLMFGIAQLIPDSKYSLTVVANVEERGSVEGSREDVALGEHVTVTATPNYGYTFEGWYDGERLLSNSVSYVYVMPPRDKTLTANFGFDEFTLTVSSEESAFIGSMKGVYSYLDQVKLTANDDIPGKMFIGWYSDDQLLSLHLEYMHTVTKDENVVAKYYVETPFEVLSLPTAEEAKAGQRLEQVDFHGGESTVPGYFHWAEESAIVTESDEYAIAFRPLAIRYPELYFFIPVTVAQNKLEMPAPSLKDGLLSWGAVEGSNGYTVSINGEEIRLPATQTQFELPTELGEYFVSVRADGDGEIYGSSAFSGMLHYTPSAPKMETFGGGTSEYKDGVLTKFAGNIKLDDNTEFTGGTDVDWTTEYIRFKVSVDLQEHLKGTTKSEILKINGIPNSSTEVSITLVCEVTLWWPEFYAETDMDFPATIHDLAFGISYETMTATVAEIHVNGEFVSAENRRTTLHLLFLDLVGLEEPIYKWKHIDILVPGTGGLLSIELSVGFDALGAIAASLSMDVVESSNYLFGLQLIKDGKAVFTPYFQREFGSATYDLTLAGELDVNLNFVRIAATLKLRELALVRLNLDLLNLETDLSGEASLSLGMNGTTINKNNTSAKLDMDGAYRLYGQVTFEYYLEIRFKFGFLPLDNFGIKVLDGSLILAEWEYAKGGLPKTCYRDEALSKVTPIYATDGVTEYFKNKHNTLLQSQTGYVDGLRAAFLDGEEVVDIDNYYVYVFDGDNLRRVGRHAGTERTVLSGVSQILGSDRNFIYYTLEGSENKIRRYYRTDYESVEPVYASLPAGWEGVRMRYDYVLDCFVIYAENATSAAYFTYDGYYLTQHGANEHKYWDKVEYENGMIAYYSMDRDGRVTEGFVRTATGGAVHEDNVDSVGVTPLGLFIVKESKDKDAVLPYEMGIYTLEGNAPVYRTLSSISSADAASRVTYCDGMVYYTDVGEGRVRVFRTDGNTAELVFTKPFNVLEVDGETLYTEVYDGWLFIYSHERGSAKVIFTVELETLRFAPYVSNGEIAEYDRGNPEDVQFDIVGSNKVAGVFLGAYSEEMIKKFSDTMEKLGKYEELTDKVKDKIAEYIGFDTEDLDEAINLFKENEEYFHSVSTRISFTADAEDGLKVTIPKEALDGYDYGLYHGYIVTLNGVVPMYIHVTDSREGSLITEDVQSFDKALPREVTFDVYVYDQSYTLNAPKDAYNVVKTEIDKIRITLYASYLAQQNYGDHTVTLKLENGKTFALTTKISDSRSPADSDYVRTFDKTYAKDIVFDFNLFDEKAVTSVSGNDIPENGAFSISKANNTLRFYKNYLKSLFIGEYEYKVTTTQKSFTVRIRVIQSKLPTADTAITHNLGSLQDIQINFAPNDASVYDIYLDGELLQRGDAYGYNFEDKQLRLFNSYLQSKVANGKHTLSIRSLIVSGDEIKSHNINVALTITDSRAVSVDTRAITYTITESSAPICIRVELYGRTVQKVVADSNVNLGYTFQALDSKGQTDYRGGYIYLSRESFADRLSEGTHTLTVTVSGATYNISLTLVDERMPIVLASTYKYNLAAPAVAAYSLRLYGEEFVSLSGNGLSEDDYAVHEVVGTGMHSLRISNNFLQTLPVVKGETYTFTVITGVNAFNVYVSVYDSNDWGDDKDDGYYGDNNGVYYPSVDYSTPVISPSVQEFDLGAPAHLVYDVDYGYNNAFGSLRQGIKTLKQGTDYLVTKTGIKISGVYLSKFGYGTHTFTLVGAYGNKCGKFDVKVVDSRNPYLYENGQRFTCDKYVGGSIVIGAQLRDSVVSKLSIGGMEFTEGFTSGNGKITVYESAWTQLPLGEYTVQIYYNDCETVSTVVVDVHDTGLYFTSPTKADKAKFDEPTDTLSVTWTLYEGEVTSVWHDTPLTVLSFDNSGIKITGLDTAAYGDYTFTITANGHTFTLVVNVYDSRKPKAQETTYTFDKADYAYTLNPTDAKKYDLQVEIELYDEKIDGYDIMSNQTITGNGLAYEDYRREGNSYWLSYLYLYRLRIGTYNFEVATTDGIVTVKVVITDENAPVLVSGNPVVYDYEAAGDQEVVMKLFGEQISSISYTHFMTGSLIPLTAEDYHFTKDEAGNDVLVLHRSLLEGFFMGRTYEFLVATTTERTLEFNLTLINGVKSPYTVIFYSVPWDRGEPAETIVYQTVYEGEYIVEPETPSHEYYNFLGFYTERSGGKVVDFSQAVYADMNIFLHWEPKTYNITLISDGETLQTIPVRYLSEIPEIADPQRTGYSFVKWTTDEAHTVRFDSTGEEMPHQDFSLYAEWTINSYVVRFVDFNGTLLKEETVLAYGDATPPADEDMQREHYTFNGWSESYTSILWDRTLTAKYTAISYPITYTLNGGTNAASNPSKYIVEDYVEFAAPKRTGYEFLGWYYTEDFSGEQATEIPYGSFGEVHIYAKWQVNTYNVYLSTPYGLDPETPGDFVEITYDAEFTLPVAIVPDGVKFEGWYTGENGTGTKYTGSDGVGLRTWNIASNTTFYAYLVEIIEFKDVKVNGVDATFTLVKNVSDSVNITDIKLYNVDIKRAVDMIIGELTVRTYTFAYLEEMTNYEIRLTYKYDLGDGNGERKAERRLEVFIPEQREMDVLGLQTVAQVQVGRAEFDTWTVDSIIVKDVDGNVVENASVFYPASASVSYLNNDGNWIYVGNLLANTVYHIEVAYTYTQADYVGTYTGSFVTEVETNGTAMDIPNPIMSITTSHVHYRTSGSVTNYHYYFQYTFYGAQLNPFLENDARLVRWELWNADGTEIVASGDVNKNAAGNASTDCVTLNETTMADGTRYIFRMYYSYNLQDGNDTIEEMLELSFVADTYQYDDSCLVNGEKVLMADGSEKNVEDVALGEYVQVWDFHTGKLSASKVVMKHTVWLENNVFNLHFENGSTVGIGSQHAFFVKENNQFVSVTWDNAESFIGKQFAVLKGDEIVWTKLTQVEKLQGGAYVTALITAENFNHFADGFLSAVQYVDVFNLFDYDDEEMRYDAEKKAADLEKYGELPYEFWADIATYEQYCYLNGRYFSVVIGRGQLTYEQLVAIAQNFFPMMDME